MSKKENEEENEEEEDEEGEEGEEEEEKKEEPKKENEEEEEENEDNEEEKKEPEKKSNQSKKTTSKKSEKKSEKSSIVVSENSKTPSQKSKTLAVVPVANPQKEQSKKSSLKSSNKNPSIKSGSKKSKIVIDAGAKETKSVNSKKTVEGQLPTYDEYMKSDPEMVIPTQDVNYVKRYGKMDENSELDKKSKKSKISEKSKKSKVSEKISEKSKKSKSTTSSKLIMYNDFLNTDPDKDLEIKDIDYSKRYGLSDEQKEQQEKNKEEKKDEEEKKSEKKPEEEKKSEKISQHSKKSKISLTKPINQFIPMTFDNSNDVCIHPNRVVIKDENEKDKLSKILCSGCQMFPLEPKICSECNYIFCDDCLKGKTKCQNCNSIFKQGKLTEELNHLYSLVNIKCCYAQCGCDKELPPYELLNHQENCKNTKKKCSTCQQEITYEKYINHINSCQHNLKQCDLCSYRDTDVEYNKTNQIIQHMRHILIPEIHSIIRNELQQFFGNINTPKNEQNQQIQQTAPQGLSEELDKKLFDIQQLLLNIQPNDFIGKKDDVGTMIKVSHLERKIKSIQLINTIPSKIDNAFECDNKFCVINTFKKDNFICFPNLKYGIDLYNLSTEQIETIIPKAHESSITCMVTETDKNKSLTYLATASYDRNIKVYTIENKWKKIRSFREIFNDYSTFSLDMFYNNKEIVIIAGNENSKQIKILYPENDDINSIKFLTMNSKIFCIKHNFSNLEEFFVGNEEGIYLFSIFNLPGINEGKDSNIKPDKMFIDKDEDKSKHLCMTIIEEDKNLLVEGDSIGIIRVWSIKDKQMMKKIKRGILKYQINSVASWNGRFIISGSRDGKINIYDVSDGIYIGEVGEHQGYIYCIKVADHWKYEKMIVSSGFDGALKIWASKD